MATGTEKIARKRGNSSINECPGPVSISPANIFAHAANNQSPTNVLVATTVVELGIDVPSATVMIVEGADRFGLAQLHQLRGRVGRGTRPGACWLCTGDAPITDEARARLSLLAATDDGFALAEADLAQRGAGDVYGTRQAGEVALAADSLAEMAELTALARAEAEALWAADPGLTAPAHAAAAAAARERSRTLYGGDAG